MLEFHELVGDGIKLLLQSRCGLFSNETWDLVCGRKRETRKMAGIVYRCDLWDDRSLKKNVRVGDGEDVIEHTLISRRSKASQSTPRNQG